MKYVADFKDTTLYEIYKHCTYYLDSFFKNQFSFEKFEYSMLFFSEIAKCLNVCLDFEDDINYKDDINMNKYNLKPIYVPNLNAKRKEKKNDRRLDIGELNGIVKNLYDTYMYIAKNDKK
jgi:hypothetical protein